MNHSKDSDEQETVDGLQYESIDVRLFSLLLSSPGVFALFKAKRCDKSSSFVVPVLGTESSSYAV